MPDKRKALLICGLATVFYLVFSSYLFINFGTPNNTNDFEAHWGGIHGSPPSNYRTGYYALFNYFDENKEVFFAMNVVLICFMLPMLLFLITKTWWATIIYFAATGLPHQWLFNATFPQAVVFTLIAVYLLNRKNWWIFLLCALFASTIHRQGLMIFLAILAAEAFLFFVQNLKLKKFVPAVAVLQGAALSFPTLLSVFLLSLTLPLLWLGRKIVKDYFLLFLAIVGVVMSVVDLRSISLTQFSLILVAAQGLKDSPNKKFWVSVLFLQAIFLVSVYGVETIKTIVLNT